MKVSIVESFTDDVITAECSECKWVRSSPDRATVQQWAALHRCPGPAAAPLDEPDPPPYPRDE